MDVVAAATVVVTAATAAAAPDNPTGEGSCSLCRGWVEMQLQRQLLLLWLVANATAVPLASM